MSARPGQVVEQDDLRAVAQQLGGQVATDETAPARD